VQEVAVISDLGKSYLGRVIFNDVNITIRQNEPIVIMGENGCGKSTLLKIIAGVLGSTQGKVIYRPNTKISFIPDRFPKLPFNIEDYLMHMGKIQGLSASRINNFIDEYFDYLKMPQNFRKTKIAHCSKGTMQKVNILQALLTQPDLLVLDEPFAGLDEDSEDNFLELLFKLSCDGVAIILACHEKKLAQRISDNIYIFADGQCRISDGFIEQMVVRYLDNGQTFTQLVERHNLNKALGLLITQGCEICSVNPKTQRHLKGTKNESKSGID